MSIVKAACVQLTSTPDVAANLKVAQDLVREAAGKGARLISTPENTDMINPSLKDSLAKARSEGEHPVLPLFSALAKELGVWLLLGSVKIRLERKMANRSYLFNPAGDVAATYDKIHLFDVDLPTGERHRESSEIEGGRKAVVASTDCGKLGLSICYDLRFAYLYRALAQAGAEILAIPSAFTVPTGQAHWSVLQRARAIETGSFVLSAAQCGQNCEGRKTYGHSIIVDPWGQVLAQGGDTPGIITAELDLAAVAKARQAIPALQHDRDYAF
jgi:predicted amidohydrolase